MTGKYSQKYFEHTEQYTTDALKSASKIAIQKIADATGDLIGNKTFDVVAKFFDGKITKIFKTCNKIIQKQLQMSMKKKYLKKDIFLQKKDRKLPMIWANIIEYQKTLYLWDKTLNQPSKNRAKNG